MREARRRFVVALMAGMMSSAAVQPARAQAPSAPPAASPLFDEAKALMKEEKYGEAIPKLLAFVAQEKTVGGLFNLGVCYEKLGATASAWRQFKAAEKLAREKSDPREAVARDRAAALESRVSKITVTVPPGEDVPGLEVKLDGVILPREEWRVPVPIDAGRHTVEAIAPGKQRWSSDRSAGPAGGEWTSLAIGPLVAAEDAHPSPPPAAPPAATSSGLGGQRIGAIAAAGAGVIALGIGTVFGISASSKNSDSKTHCTPSDPNACDATGVGLRADARSAGNVGTAMFIVSGVALAGGVALWLTAPKSKTTTAVGVGPSGIAVRGTW